MASKSSKFEIFPLVHRDGEWSIPDEVLVDCWNQIVKEDKAKDLFYDGSVKTPYDWVSFLKEPGTFPIIVAKNRRIIHVLWLKDLFDVGAWIHHCAIGKYQRGLWEAARDHWRTVCPSLKILLGLTPETNELGVKILTKICKFTIVGKVPLMCNMAYEGRRVAGVFSYFEM